MKKIKTQNIAICGLMAALCYVGYAVFPAINVSGTKVHLGNAFVVLGALMLGGGYGGLAGAIGLTIADLTLGYASSAPRTFITKLVLGLIVGLVAHKIGHIFDDKDRKHILKWSIIASAAGLLFNCIFEPALKWLWYTLLFPNPDKAAGAIKTMLAITTYTTMINAVINGVAAVLLFMAVYGSVKKYLK